MLPNLVWQALEGRESLGKAKAHQGAKSVLGSELRVSITADFCRTLMPVSFVSLLCY